MYGNGARSVTDAGEPGQTTAFSFVGVHRELLVGSSARMNHVIGAAANCVTRPGIHNVKDQRAVNGNVRMQAGVGLPGAVTNTGYEFSSLPGGMKRDRTPIAQHGETMVHDPCHLDLQPLNGRIDAAGGAPAGSFLT